MTMTERLLEATKEIWAGYNEKPFVKGIADGSLDHDKFKYYMIQDYLYLIDYTIVNERLCRWVGDELELPKLAEELRRLLRENGSMEEFVLTILKESNIYAAAEIHKMQSVLEQLQSQRDVEKEKYNSSLSPRENIKIIRKICDTFILNFDDPHDKNLLFTGNTGLGKTFLSNCIANELLKKGKVVLYQTAPIMLDSIINYRMRKS